MKTLKIRDHTINAWAEPVGGSYQGLATVSPSIPNTWSGGPDGRSLVCDGVHDSVLAAETAALDAAREALLHHLGKNSG